MISFKLVLNNRSKVQKSDIYLKEVCEWNLFKTEDTQTYKLFIFSRNIMGHASNKQTITHAHVALIIIIAPVISRFFLKAYS